jgi:FtsP/CotA-like multicopper oxidase with cupredoxin domain
VTRFIQYEADFKTPAPQPDWLGIMGPIIRAEVGDTVIVHFCNRAEGSYGMHPHGFRYTKDNEGAHFFGANSGSAPGAGAEVMPGQCFDYTWIADQDSGPAQGELSSKVWWYHSHIDEPAEANKGLLGPIIITRKGEARRDGSPKDVDQEFVTAFFIFDKLGGEEERTDAQHQRLYLRQPEGPRDGQWRKGELAYVSGINYPVRFDDNYPGRF